MVTLEDLYNVATAMDSQMLLLHTKNNHDFRPGAVITLTMPQLDLRGIDEQLYQKENGTMVGYESGDEVNVKILGITFHLVAEEDITKKEA